MRFEQTIQIDRPPEDVFAYMTDTSKLATWQTTTVDVLRDREGPLVQGERLREVHAAPLGRRVRSTVEVAECDPPRAFALRILDGPLPLDGSWTLEAVDGSTRLHFVGQGALHGPMRLLDGLATRSLAKQFLGHHRRLKAALEAQPPRPASPERG
jgi:uncharacterized protein YndB with AHSA1/START domain